MMVGSQDLGRRHTERQMRLEVNSFRPDGLGRVGPPQMRITRKRWQEKHKIQNVWELADADGRGFMCDM